MRKLEAGTKYVGRFALAACLGAGAFGEVWRAHDTVSDTEIALKILFEDWMHDAAVVERFEREVSVMARLQHPGIAQLLDAGRDEGGCPYYSMTLVHGTPLNSLPDNLATILEVFDKLLAALGYAHARGIVHRDLKPDNILVSAHGDDWSCRILDFGIAQMDEPKRQGTECGQVLGTLEYMSPEQASGFARSVGPASDVYSTGVMLYELLSGRVPFEGQGLQILAAHVMDPPPPLLLKPALESSVSEPLIQLVGQMLAKRYSDRPETCGDVRTKLAGILEAVVRELGPTAAATSASVSGGYRSATVNRPSNAELTRTASLGNDGLSVVRMRDPVPAGRSELKAALWEAAQEVIESRKPAVALLSGPAGIGKSRLARWLAEMVHEPGLMRVVRAEVTPRGGLLDALHTAIDRILRSPPMVRRTLRRWIDDVLPIGEGPDRTALCDFLLTQRAGHVAEVAESDWLGLSSMVLSKVAQFPTSRPLMVWIDGPGNEDETEVARWIGHILDMAAAESLPLFVVWSTEAARSETGLALRKIASRHLAIALHSTPFNLAETAALVKQLTPPLSERALRILHTSSKGNPLGVRELLLGWIERGELEATPAGLDLLNETGAFVPLAVNQVIVSRLDNVLAAAGKHRGELATALMAMAHLGERISMDQARVLLEPSGIAPFTLVQEGILLQHPNQERTEFAFANGLLVETLQSRTRSEQRLGQVLRQAAMAALDDGLRAVVRGEWQQAERNLTLVSSLLDELEISESHPLRLEILNAFAHIARRRQEGELLERLASVMSERALELSDESLSNLFEASAEHWRGRAQIFQREFRAARRHLWTAQALSRGTSEAGLKASILQGLALCAERLDPDEVSRELFQRAAHAFGDAIVAEKRPAMRRFLRYSAAVTNRSLALCYAASNRTDEAIRLLISVQTAHQELEDPSGEAYALLFLARIQRQAGRVEGSQLYLKLAVAALAKLGDKHAAALLSWEEAALAFEQNDLIGARALFEQASKLFIAVTDRAGHAMCVNAFGEIARRAGRHSEALEHYARFRQTMELLSQPRAVASAYTNIGWTHNAMGAFDEARMAFSAALDKNGSEPSSEHVARLIGMARAQIGLGVVDAAVLSLSTAKGASPTLMTLDEDAVATLAAIRKTSEEQGWSELRALAEELSANTST